MRLLYKRKQEPFVFTLTVSNGTEIILPLSSDPGTMTGNDGKIYPTVKIGNQVWMARNLAETKYRNGDDIPIVTDASAWLALSTGALCAYNNDWNRV